MAYFYNNPSNYSEVPDNYQYYHQYYYNQDQDHYSSNYDDYSRYVPYYDNTQQFHGNAFQLAPTPPLVGYYYSNYIQPSKNDGGYDYYYDEPVSTQYAVYHNTTNAAESEASDVVFEEHNPKPFHGGYDINEKYGKPMSPNEKICYPPTSKDNEVDPNKKITSLGDFSYGDIPNPYVEEKNKKVVEPKQGNGVAAPNKVIHEEDHEHPSDFEDDDDDYDDEDDDDGGEEGGEKEGDLGKEASSKTAALGDGAVVKKQEQNLEDVGNKPKDGEVIQERKASDFEANEEDDEDEDEDEDDYDDDEDEGEEKQGDIGKKEPLKTNQIVPLNDGINGKETKDVGNEGKPKNGKVVGEVIQEQKPSNFEGKKEEEKKGGLIDEGRKEDEIKRQIPAGYGMEALDLCEGLFGGYFPCLWKKKQGNLTNNNTKNVNVNQQSGNYESLSDYDYCCKETVDYLFGNPNPYGGMMPEKGSYGDPMYCYQRCYPQQAVSEQVECYGGGNSSVINHGYGYNNGDYYQ